MGAQIDFFTNQAPTHQEQLEKVPASRTNGPSSSKDAEQTANALFRKTNCGRVYSKLRCYRTPITANELFEWHKEFFKRFGINDVVEIRRRLFDLSEMEERKAYNSPEKKKCSIRKKKVLAWRPL